MIYLLHKFTKDGAFQNLYLRTRAACVAADLDLLWRIQPPLRAVHFAHNTHTGTGRQSQRSSHNDNVANEINDNILSFMYY